MNSEKITADGYVFTKSDTSNKMDVSSFIFTDGLIEDSKDKYYIFIGEVKGDIIRFESFVANLSHPETYIKNFRGNYVGCIVKYGKLQLHWFNKHIQYIYDRTAVLKTNFTIKTDWQHE